MKKTLLSLGFTLFALCAFTQEGFVRKGYYNKIETGLIPLEFNGAYSIQVQNGYQFNERLGLGLGIGLKRVQYENFIPFSLDFNYRILKGKVSPFTSLSVGYDAKISPSYAYYNHYRGGLTGGLQAGVWFAVTEHISLLSSVGYRYLNSIYSPCFECIEAWESFVPYKNSGPIHAAEFKFGIVIQ